MALNASVAARNAMADAFSNYLGSGAKLVLYTGPQPTDATGAATTVLATIPLNASGNPFTVASNGAIALVGVPLSATASASGVVAWARLFKSDGTTVGGDLSVGTTGTDIIISNTTLSSGNTEQITSLTITFPA